MNAKRIIALLLFVLLSGHALPQKKSSIVLVGKSKSDGIWLRWAPNDITTWQLGNKYGYTIERFTLKADGDLDQASKYNVTTTPLKPYSEDQFKKLTNPSDEVSTIEELLYHENFQAPYKQDDIGSILSKSRELENRFGMALLMCDFSIEAAQAAGLFIKDTRTEKGQRYVYRIKIVTQTIIEPTAIVLSATDEKPLPALKDLTVTFESRKATLTWSTILNKGAYTAYYIEKSTDGKNFKRLSDLPYVHMTQKLQSEEAHFVDSLDANNKTVYYRINGISPFAEAGPYSNVVSGQGKDNLGGLLIIREGKVVEGTRVRLVWEFPVNAEYQIAGFIVASSNNPNIAYQDVIKKPLPRSSREYMQETLFYNTYYILRAVDNNGVEITRSFPFLVQVPDQTPPANPTGLTGKMAKDGVATLTWNANTDKDFMAYRVFRSNSLHEDFVEVTKEFIPKPYFIDTVNIRVLNKKIYYYVVAVDKNYNPSDYSNLLTLTRPDIIAPTAPVFKETEMKNDSITLRWENSVSDDIKSYELVRIEKEDKLNRVIKTWYAKDSLTYYADKGVTLGKTYSYKIIASDSSDNKSTTTSREVFFESGVRKPVSNITVLTDREKKSITLSWKNEKTVSKCTVFRKMNDGKFVIHETLEGNIQSFTDKNIPINNIYVYKIQVSFGGGIKTQLSEEIKVNF